MRLSLWKRDGQLLGWRSRGNRTDLLDTINSVLRDFGVVLSEGGVVGYSSGERFLSPSLVSSSSEWVLISAPLLLRSEMSLVPVFVRNTLEGLMTHIW